LNPSITQTARWLSRRDHGRVQEIGEEAPRRGWPDEPGAGPHEQGCRCNTTGRPVVVQSGYSWGLIFSIFAVLWINYGIHPTLALDPKTMADPLSGRSRQRGPEAQTADESRTGCRAGRNNHTACPEETEEGRDISRASIRRGRKKPTGARPVGWSGPPTSRRRRTHPTCLPEKGISLCSGDLG